MKNKSFIKIDKFLIYIVFKDKLALLLILLAVTGWAETPLGGRKRHLAPVSWSRQARSRDNLPNWEKAVRTRLQGGRILSPGIFKPSTSHPSSISFLFPTPLALHSSPASARTQSHQLVPTT